MTAASKHEKTTTNKFELKKFIASICDDDSDEDDIELFSDSDELQEILLSLTSECLSNNSYKNSVSPPPVDSTTRRKQIAAFHLNKEIFVNINEVLFDQLINQLQTSKQFKNENGKIHYFAYFSLVCIF